MKVTAKRAGDEKPVEADFDFGENLETMIQKFGAPLVFDHAIGSLRVSLQGFMRSQIDQGKNTSQIQEAVKAWVPGKRKVAKTPAEKLRELLAAMSPEERAAALRNVPEGPAVTGGPIAEKGKAKAPQPR